MHHGIERPHRRRPRPQVVVERGRWHRIGRISPRPHVVVTINFNLRYFAQQPGLHNLFHSLHQMRGAAPLGAHLHHPLQATSRLQQRFAFGDIHANGLLQINIGPRLHRCNALKCMPMVRRFHNHQIKIFFSQKFAVVFFQPRLFRSRLPLAHPFGCLVHHPRVSVAKAHNIHRGHLNQPHQVTFAVPATTNQAYSGRLPAHFITKPTSGTPRCQCSARQKYATIHSKPPRCP